MTTIVFAVVMVICAVGWFKNHIAVLVLSSYLINKGYKTPTDDELMENTRFVFKNLFRKQKR